MNGQNRNTSDIAEDSRAEGARYNLRRLAQRNHDLPLGEIGNSIPEQDPQDARVVELEDSVRRLTDHLARQGNDRAAIEEILNPRGDTRSFSRSGGSEDEHANTHGNGDGHTHSRADESEDTPASNDRDIANDIPDARQGTNGRAIPRETRSISPSSHTSRSRSEMRMNWVRTTAHGRTSAANPQQRNDNRELSPRRTNDLRHHLNARRSSGSQLPPENGVAHTAARPDRNNGAPHRTTPVDQASNERGQNGLPATHADVATMLNDFRNEVQNLVVVQNMTQEVRGMMELTASPFTTNILAEEFPADFCMPDLPRYEGKTDPLHHIQQYRMWMSVKRSSPAILCQAFSSR